MRQATVRPSDGRRRPEPPHNLVVPKEIRLMNRRSMTNDTDVPARHESAGVLYARASEYRRMATTASTAVDARALGDLAVRFTALADEREFQERLVRGETESPSCL